MVLPFIFFKFVSNGARLSEAPTSTFLPFLVTGDDMAMPQIRTGAWHLKK